MADYYGSLAAAAVFIATLPGGAAWTAMGVDDTARTNALTRASRTVDGVYGAQFPGRKVGGRSQAREWPRIDAEDQCTGEAIPSDEVPLEVEQATYAIALDELTSPGQSSPTVTPGRITKREKVDVVEREFFGASDGNAPSADDLRPVNMLAAGLLRCLLASQSGGSVWTLRY